MLHLLTGKGSGHSLFNRMNALKKLIRPFDAKWIKLNGLGVFCLSMFSQWLFPSVSLDSNGSGVGLGRPSAKSH